MTDLGYGVASVSVGLEEVGPADGIEWIWMPKAVPLAGGAGGQRPPGEGALTRRHRGAFVTQRCCGRGTRYLDVDLKRGDRITTIEFDLHSLALDRDVLGDYRDDLLLQHGE